MNPVISEVLGNKYCKACILSKSGDHILVRDQTISMNANYVPDKIGVLFAAESPPLAFLTEQSRYFYALGPIRYGGLFYHTMSVLFEEEMRECTKYAKEYFLKRFKKRGFYLVDIVKCPINMLPKKEKAQAIESCSRYLNRELNLLDFQKVVFIGKGSFRKAKRHLDLDHDHAVIPLPFGSNKNVQNFRKELTKLHNLS